MTSLDARRLSPPQSRNGAGSVPTGAISGQSWEIIGEKRNASVSEKNMIVVRVVSFDSDEEETSSFFLSVNHTLNLHFIKKV